MVPYYSVNMRRLTKSLVSPGIIIFVLSFCFLPTKGSNPEKLRNDFPAILHSMKIGK